jgi:protein TonB
MTNHRQSNVKSSAPCLASETWLSARPAAFLFRSFFYGALFLTVVAPALSAQNTQPPAAPKAVKVKTTPPVIVEKPDLHWPKRNSAVSLSPALVSITVNVAGAPENVHLLRSCGDAAFDTAVLEAVQAYRFKPATREGVPIPFTMNVEVDPRPFK